MRGPVGARRAAVRGKPPGLYSTADVVALKDS